MVEDFVVISHQYWYPQSTGCGNKRAGIAVAKDFLKLVFIALLIASPLAWYCMHAWLDNFAYCVPVGWWIFADTGIVTTVLRL